MRSRIQRWAVAVLCSETSTGMGLGLVLFDRPPPRTSRWNETFIARKMDFKGWVTDYSKSSPQGITDVEITKFLNDLEKWCHNKPKSGLTGTRSGRNKEHGRGKLW